ncbi:MAG: glycine oxidase ThiO [Pseudomonadota bacterium]
MDMQADVIVIGAGLIGLAIADELARRGRRVRVLADRPVRNTASWAGAGMLTPHPERSWHPVSEQLCLRSFEMYPAFVGDLQERTGVDCELRMDGLLVTAGDVAGERNLRERTEELRDAGREARWLDAVAVRETEPALSVQEHGGILLADTGQVNNRQLLAALEAACLKRGVTIDREAAGVRLVVEGERVRGVQTAAGPLTAPVVVNAAGAWAHVLPGVPDAAVVPVKPVKGQMLAFELASEPIRRVTWADGLFLVPGAGRRLLVGATLEQNAGFDERVTAGTVHDLIGKAQARCPALAGAALVEAWAGLRPGTPDELPCVGATPVEGYVLACGHYRNGIVLTPVTALQVADLLDGKADAVDRAFTLERFRPAAAA